MKKNTLRDHHVLITLVVLIEVKWKLVFECIARISDAPSDPGWVVRHPEHCQPLMGCVIIFVLLHKNEVF